MKKLASTSGFYAVIGLLLGVYYREFTKYNGFTGKTQLSVVHTHTLTLGMIMFLIVLLLEKNFKLSDYKQFNLFYILYNIGVIGTISLLTYHGTMTVLGKETGAAISGIAGLFHIILAAGIALLFHCLVKGVRKFEKESQK